MEDKRWQTREEHSAKEMKAIETTAKTTAKFSYVIKTKYADWWPFLFPHRLTLKGVIIYQWQEGVSFSRETRCRLLESAIRKKQQAVLVTENPDGGEVKKLILGPGQRIADGVREFLKKFSQKPAKLVICASNSSETVCHVYHGKHLVL